MRTSLNEISLLDAYLHNELMGEEKLLLEARFIIEEQLKDHLFWQRQSYRFVRDYGRQNLREQLQIVEEEFLGDPRNETIIQRIKSYFKKRRFR